MDASFPGGGADGANRRTDPVILDRTPALLPSRAGPVTSDFTNPAFRALRRKLLLTSGLRVLMMLALAGATFLFGGGPYSFLETVRGGLMWAAIVGIVPASLYLPAIFAVRKRRGLRRIAFVQIIQDCLFAAFLVAATGGSQSAFTFFFSITIVIAGTLIGRAGTYLSVALSALLLLLLGACETGLVPPPGFLEDLLVPASAASVYYAVGINLVAFISIGFLSSYLAEALRRSDIQRERYRSTLEDLRQLHESILASVEVGIMTCRLDNRILHMNRAAEELTGVDFGAAKGLSAVDVLPDVARPMADGLHRFEFERSGRDGGMRQLMAVVTPLLSRTGEMVGRIVVLDDVSVIKSMEARMKADERLTTIGKLSAVVAHEIRNPLATISASAQMLSMMSGLKDDDRRVLDIVVREADRLNLWITDLLDYTRPRKGEVVPVDLPDVLEQAIDVVRGLPSASRVEIVTDFEPGLRVRGDPQRLVRVFQNLCKNAVEAMTDGGVLQVRCWSEVQGPRQWAVASVADNGCGIPAEEVGRVFDAFFTTKATGTGLGLATVSQIVEEHGGHVTLMSEPDVKTEFTVRLPRTVE